MLTWSQHSIFFISLVFHFAIVKSANYFWRLFCIDTTRFNGRYPFIYYCWTENVRLYNLFLRKRNKRKQVKSQTRYVLFKLSARPQWIAWYQATISIDPFKKCRSNRLIFKLFWLSFELVKKCSFNCPNILKLSFGLPNWFLLKISRFSIMQFQ